MGRVIGLLVVVVIVGLMYKFYFAKLQSAGTGTPTQAISEVGVKNDLLQIAQAERMYQAQHNSYASLDELVSSGAMTMAKSGRDGYTYEVETSAEGFRAIARCAASASPGCTNWAVDQNMEVKPAP
jgi:competence protein ComGC